MLNAQTLAKIIAQNEVNPIAQSWESDAGEIIYFDPFLNDWITLGGR